MAPRSGQLDEISQSIGRLEGSVKAVERYVHDERHDKNDLSQKVDGLAAHITREIVGVEARIEARYEARIQALETFRQQQAGAKNFAVALLQSPLMAWMFAAAVMIATWWKKV
jgi:hypothetical protein